MTKDLEPTGTKARVLSEIARDPTLSKGDMAENLGKTKNAVGQAIYSLRERLMVVKINPEQKIGVRTFGDRGQEREVRENSELGYNWMVTGKGYRALERSSYKLREIYKDINRSIRESKTYFPARTIEP